MDPSTANQVALTFFTFVLALFTYFLWKETKKTRLQNVTPQISVYFYPISSTIIGMKIENTSQVDARDIYVKCLNNQFYTDKKNRQFIYSEKLSKKFSYIPPRQSYSFFIGYYHVMKKEIFEFDISFSNMYKDDIVSYRISVDMSQLERSLYERDVKENIAENIEKLYRVISSITEYDNNKRGLRVYPYSVAERKIKKLEEAVDFYRECSEENSSKSKD